MILCKVLNLRLLYEPSKLGHIFRKFNFLIIDWFEKDQWLVDECFIDSIFQLVVLKVSKSQKHFLLKLHCPKKGKKYLTKFCPMKLGQNFVKYFVHFLGNGVSRKKCFWDLLTFTDLLFIINIFRNANINFSFIEPVLSVNNKQQG